MLDNSEVSILSQQRILVVGLARDCEKRVQKDILRLMGSLKLCQALSWLVIESDSRDNTVVSLRMLEGSVPGFRFISLGALKRTMPLRTQRIAYCRNVYLEELKSNPLYADVDYVVVADLDGVNDLVTTAGFASCWTRHEWDVCTANQRGPYYDIWALRHRFWSPNDCLQQYWFLLAHRIRREAALWAAIYSKMIIIDETDDWIEVDSAFGGLAIYSRQVLCGVQYVGVDEAGREVCEHVSLNEQIRSHGYRIFINPSLVNTAGTEHSHQRTMLPRIRRYYYEFRHRAKELLLGARKSG
jgi:hypothetical protein